MSFSLLLRELAHPPSRLQLEIISEAVPGIAKADCAGFLDHWLGIVASHLEPADARAFQAALRGAGYETDIVPDCEIPALHPDFRCQRLALDESSFILTDAMGRVGNVSRNDLVFAAAGVVRRQKWVTTFRTEIVPRFCGEVSVNVPVETRTKQEQEQTFFRIDLFFSREPYRISLEIDADRVLFYADRPIRIKHTLDLKILMTDLSMLLPQDRMNTGLRERTLDFVYSGVKAYEEEIRWAFHRLGARG